MKKLFALFLVSVMALALLSACGDNTVSVGVLDSNLSASSSGKTDIAEANKTNTDSNPLVSTNTSTSVTAEPEQLTNKLLAGTWETNADMAMLAPELGIDAEILLYFTFTEDDRVVFFANEAKLMSAIEQAARSVLTKEYLAEQMGVTVAEVESQIALQGMTWEQFVEAAIEEGMAAYQGENSPFPPADEEGNIVLVDGYYKLESTKLYVSTTTEFTEDDGVSYTYKAGTIALTENDISLILIKK